MAFFPVDFFVSIDLKMTMILIRYTVRA
jgi:hypothetical protein